MITHELARELKEVGYVFRELKVGDDIGSDWVIIDGKQYVAPTLSELIEACGWKITLHADKEVSTAIKWVGPELGHLKAEGSTPEEAVGMLYIALHKK